MDASSQQEAASPRSAGPASQRAATGRVCPHFHAAVELIGRRWAGAILYALTGGPMRFAELAAAVPEMSDRLLSQRLKDLQREGLIERKVRPGSPVAVTYALTEKGAGLEPAIGELRDWARRWKRK